jgi:hypothetical protein
MRFVEELNVLRYYKPFIDAGGGVKQVQTALKWSEWYAVKWWEEVYSELGASVHKRKRLRPCPLHLAENQRIP